MSLRKINITPSKKRGLLTLVVLPLTALAEPASRYDVCENTITYQMAATLGVPADVSSIPSLSATGIGVLVVLMAIAGTYYWRRQQVGGLYGLLAFCLLGSLGLGGLAVQAKSSALELSSDSGGVLSISVPPIDVTTPLPFVEVRNTSGKSVRITEIVVEGADPGACKSNMLIPSGGTCNAHLSCAESDPQPVTPRPISPTPVDPAPVNPTPVGPTPVNPTPVNPTPVEPAPINPAPVNPTPVEPAPINPAPVSPTPVEPAPINPAPVSPTPVEPAPINPAPVSPTPVEPTPGDLPPFAPPPHIIPLPVLPWPRIPFVSPTQLHVDSALTVQSPIAPAP
ncbi:hypothetical protein DR66_2776 [Delftia acidovorans]|uniref:midcut-by-XrtH protein n=1 Tax=Delftia acidovorans TaxID=80866 RepID=UPI0005062AD3|nr:hypothetical protein DR66_2776 [Delftia acidovorans]